MSTQIPSRPETAAKQRESPWAGGLILFASALVVAAAGVGQVAVIWALATFRRDAL
jgi:hypothetical protein